MLSLVIDKTLSKIDIIVNQNLKDETGRIKNFCGIASSINAERFKLTLSEYLTENMAAYQDLASCVFERG